MKKRYLKIWIAVAVVLILLILILYPTACDLKNENNDIQCNCKGVKFEVQSDKSFETMCVGLSDIRIISD